MDAMIRVVYPYLSTTIFTRGREVWALARTRHAFPDLCCGRVDLLFTKQKVPYKAKIGACIHEQVVRVTRLSAINCDHFLVTCSNPDADSLRSINLKTLEMPPFCKKPPCRTL